MRDGHLGQMSISNHRIELTSENTQPLHSKIYRAWPKAKEFEKAGVDKVFFPERPRIRPDRMSFVDSVCADSVCAKEERIASLLRQVRNIE